MWCRHVLAAGGRTSLNVGNSWVAGLIWGSRSGNMNNGQASQVEFTINPPNQPGRDTYDISLVVSFIHSLPEAVNIVRCSIVLLQQQSKAEHIIMLFYRTEKASF